MIPDEIAPSAKAHGAGSPRISGFDPDGNGLFELLRVDVDIAVTQAGRLFVQASLIASNGDLIAQGSLDPNMLRSAPQFHTDLAAGQQAVSIYFEGRPIRLSGADGPYTVRIELFGAGSSLQDTIEATTPRYRHEDFQAELITVQAATDRGINTDATPGYNQLRIEVAVEALAAGTVMVQGQLFAGDTHLETISQSIKLQAGKQAIDLDFSAAAITTGARDGPYTVYLSANDGYYTTSFEHTTSAYSQTQFQPKP